ncbi:TRAP transporter small permease [Vogesella oryzae]|uniref:TRAP transporter small permease n=1 Tax=Vogesella oryzae TaxID=1735285 RepID=UPI001582B323|nr:TRAP transporter small permease [Vogesella oryzae]
MDKCIKRVLLALKAMMALLLAIMVVLVFINVVLRYAFNSGITLSEELSRWSMVWMTFLAAIVGVYEKGHLNVDSLTRHLPALGQRICHLLCQGIILYLLWLFGNGSWEQMLINMAVPAPMSGLPTGLLYAAGVVFSVLSALLVALDVVRVLGGGALTDVGTQLNLAE